MAGTEEEARSEQAAVSTPEKETDSSSIAADSSASSLDTARPPASSAPPLSSQQSAYRLFPAVDDKTPSSSLPLCLPASSLAFLSSLQASYEVYSLLRQWAGQQREKFCPPSSYSTLTRSSHTIVDAAACIGFASVAFIRRPDVFHRCVACEEREDWADAVAVNARCYRREDRLTVKRLPFMLYFHTAYATDSKYASVYWDPAVPASPALSIAASGSDYELESPLTLPPAAAAAAEPSTPAVTLHTLSDCLTLLLGHPSHPVPMIVLRLPAAFDTARFVSLSRFSAEELRIGRQFGCKFLILAGAAQTAAATPSSSPATSAAAVAAPRPSPYSDPSIPLAQSRSQLLYLHQCQFSPALRHLHQRLKQILGLQLWGCPVAQAEAWRFFNSLMQRGEKDDERLYDLLHEHYHQQLLETPECAQIKQRKKAAAGRAQTDGEGGGGEDGGAQADGRANSRVQQLTALIRQHRFPPNLPASPTSLLDVGCSEGSITASLASALSIPASSAHGCDVRELPSSPLFTFSLITSDSLPYASSSVQVALALMSLHHIETVQRSIAEIHRVLQPGGLLIIREHDLNPQPLSALIDVMHGLYARVWSQPPEQPAFCDDYYAHYRPRQQWRDMLLEAGFAQCEESADRRSQHWDAGVRQGRDGYIKNPFQFYYGQYEKRSSQHEPQPQQVGSRRGREEQPRDEPSKRQR